jgi:hypothetical protein
MRTSNLSELISFNAAGTDGCGDIKAFLSQNGGQPKGVFRAHRPKLGTTLGYLGTSLLKAIETSDIEERLEKLEHGLKKPTQEAGTNRA